MIKALLVFLFCIHKNVPWKLKYLFVWQQNIILQGNDSPRVRLLGNNPKFLGRVTEGLLQTFCFTNRNWVKKVIAGDFHGAAVKSSAGCGALTIVGKQKGHFRGESETFDPLDQNPSCSPDMPPRREKYYAGRFIFLCTGTKGGDFKNKTEMKRLEKIPHHWRAQQGFAYCQARVRSGQAATGSLTAPMGLCWLKCSPLQAATGGVISAGSWS